MLSDLNNSVNTDEWSKMAMYYNSNIYNGFIKTWIYMINFDAPDLYGKKFDVTRK